MATELDLATFAYNSYRPALINEVVFLDGWSRDSSLSRPSGNYGFAADVFTNPNGEVVIAFRGTDGYKIGDTWHANLPGFDGSWSPQIAQALELVSDVLHSLPNAQLTFTGHSLGGGLASIMGVFFNRPAVAFDNAPFEFSARGAIVNSYFAYYRAYETAKGRDATPATAAELAFHSYWQDLQANPNSTPAFYAREANVRGAFLTGEFLESWRSEARTIGVLSSQHAVDIGTPTDVNGFDLHSMPLLLGMRASDGLRQAAVMLPSLIHLLQRDDLFHAGSQSSRRDLLTSLINDQLSDATPGAGALDLLASDLLLFGAQGSTRLPVLQDALIATVLERYYAFGTTSNERFISAVGSGIQFDTSEFVLVAPGPGRRALIQAIGDLVTAENSSIARNRASQASLWTVQSGTNGLTTTGDSRNEVQIGSLSQSNTLEGGGGHDLLINGHGGGTLRGGEGNDVLLGGNGNDTLEGGADNDFLSGGLGIDVMRGGTGTDRLEGGVGIDQYHFSTGDGSDTIVDADNEGRIFINGIEIEGGQRTAENAWLSADGAFTIERHGGTAQGAPTYTLVIRDATTSVQVSVVNWVSGRLGIELSNSAPPAAGETTGDVVPVLATNWTPSWQVNGTTMVRTYGELDNLRGGMGDDRLFGLAGNDSLDGLEGDDELFGGDGTDLIHGGTGFDFISGGEGSDLIFGDRIVNNLGTAIGDDPGEVYVPYGQGHTVDRSGLGWGFEVGPTTHINGTEGAMYRGGQADVIDAGEGHDWVYGDDGDDLIYGGDGNDFLIGGAGNDTLDGGIGVDTLFGDNQRNDHPHYFGYSEVLESGEDTLRGGGGNDLLVGFGSDDWLYGDEDDDKLYGDVGAIDGIGVIESLPGSEHGRDWMEGGSGNDFLYGGGGSDWLFGGADNDTLDGDGYISGGAPWGDDFLDGGDGDDVLSGRGGADQLFGGLGADRLFGDGDAPDLEPGVHGDDFLDGGEGNDIQIGGGGGDIIVGGAGDDTLFGDQGTVGLAATAQGDDYIDGGEGIDQIAGGGGADTLIGGEGNDYIEGDDIATRTPLSAHGNDVINAGAGDDVVFGGGGADVISGGSGSDQLAGDAEIASIGAQYHGNDTISGGDGNDFLWGMGGNDFLYGGNDNDYLDGDYNTETALAGNDYLDGGNGDDQLQGRGGEDTLLAGAGNDTLLGGDGNDVLRGDDGNDGLNGGVGEDTLDGGRGTDVLVGGDGADHLTGGSGDDTLSGGLGDDTYHIGSGDGRDSIQDIDGVNHIVFDASVNVNDFYIDVNNNSIYRNLIVRYGTNDLITTAAWQYASGNSYEFASGASYVYQRQEGTSGNETLTGTSGFDILVGLDGNDSLNGGVGNDSLIGEAGTDTLYGGAGSDLLAGGAGSDTYLFNLGDGHDLIRETDNSSSDYDVIRFGEGISLVNLSVTIVSNDLILSVMNTDDRIVIDDWFAAVTPARIDTLLFIGSHLNLTDLPSIVSLNLGTFGDDVLYGGSSGTLTLQGLHGNDTLDGGNANETLDGGDGNDNLYGRAGNDTYLFQRGDGQDQISETAGNDQIIFTGINRVDVTFGRQAANLIIDVPGSADRLTVLNFWQSGPSGQIESLVFSDGSRMSSGDILALGLLPVATETNDTFYGGPSNEMFAGLGGNDYLDAGPGDDTLAGDAGNDTLYGSYGNDVLNGGAGNDTLLGEEQDDQLLGGDGDDMLRGGVGRDVLDGGTGNDTLYGENSSDTFLFGRGYGQDVIHGGLGDRIVFSTGVTAGDIVLSRVNEDLVLSISGTTDTITLESWFVGSNYRVDQFVFADGSTLPAVAGIYQSFLTFAGTAASEYLWGVDDGEILRGLGGNDNLFARGGDDILYGGDGNDSLTGEDGFDQLFGEAGDDTLFGWSGNVLDGGSGNDALRGTNGVVYLFGRGYGQDTIYNNNYSSYQISAEGFLDRVIFTVGTTAADVVASRSADNLVLTIAGTTDTLTITGWFQSASNRIDRFEFADGTRLASSQEITDRLLRQIPSVGTVISGTAAADSLSGTAAAETLYGLANDDTLTGANGDLLVGGAGRDTYVFARGVGEVAIYDYDMTDAQLGTAPDRVTFDASITAADISLKRSAADLVLTINAGTDRLTIRNWFAGTNYQLGFVFTDGSTLPTAAQIEVALSTQVGTAATETIKAFEGNDTLSGQAGNDSLYGGGGDDILDGGDDSDTLYGEWGNDAMYGGGGADTLYGFVGDDVLVGGAASDALSGGDGNDLLDGGADDDSLSGGGGNDRYFFGRGYGHDTIIEGDALDEHNVVQFTSDVTAANIVFSRSGDNLVLTIAGTNDVLTISQWFGEYARSTTTFEFVDGSVLPGADQIYDLTLTYFGSDLADTIGGSDDNDILFGAAGNDNLNGQSGNDTIFGGEGNDILTGESDSGTSSLTSSGNDTLYGEGGNDTLNGGGGDDVLDGGAGDDVLRGDSGNDTYRFSIGYGRDSINDFNQYDADPYSFGYTKDQVVLGVGITLDRLLVTRIGNDLNLRVNDADQLTVTGWFVGNAVEEFRFADGTVITAAQMEARIGATLNNVAPIVETPIADQTPLQNSLFNFQIPASAFSDPNVGDSLSYAATRSDGSALPGWLIFDPSTRTLSGTPLGSDVWPFDVRITVTDALGLTAASVFRVSVQDANDAPILQWGFDTQFARDSSVYTFQIPSSTFYDPDVGDVLSYRAELSDGSPLPSWLTLDSVTRTFSGIPGEGDVGTLAIRVIARDQAGAEASYVFEMLVESSSIVGTEQADALNGTSLGDRLYGLGGDDTMNGNAGNDLLDGGTGNDILRGNAGDDIYVVDSTLENLAESTSQGTDTVRSSVTWTLGSNFENLVLLGTQNLNGTGNTLANQITGNSGNNTLSGGTGADTLIGGAGNDAYVVDNASDIVTEVASEGIDLVQSAVTYTLSAEVENLTLTGTSVINGTGNALDNILTGNGVNNTLSGGGGNDTLIGGVGSDSMNGGLGNDTFVVDNTGDVVTENANEGTDLVQSSVTFTLSNNVENLMLTGTSAINGTGNALANTLTGNVGVNVLDGGAGADTMIGGAGNDTYVVESAGDVVTENVSEGTDVIQAAVTYTLNANVENLTLTGTSGLNGTGNTLANVITGNIGNNVLDGGAGADTLVGGAGNDTYVVDNTADVVTEAASAGTDLVQASVTYTLAANVENLTLAGTTAINGTGNTLANVLTGNIGNNTLNGGTGSDTMIGGAGDDTYVVDVTGDVVTESAGGGIDLIQSGVTYTLSANVENLTLTGSGVVNGTGNGLDNVLTGNGVNNTLTGGAGNDTLDGGAGTDTMVGGTGNDTYVVGIAADVVTEAAGEGTDLVNSAATYTLGNNVENLTLTGSGVVNATGNGLDNVLTGNGVNNTLTGSAGNDTLNGAGGTDTMVGGTGNDVYFVDVTTDVTTEAASEGIDTVNSAVTRTLAANIELLFLSGSTAINGTGNTLANLLRGNGVNNVLAGGGGTDILEGGAGNDTLSNTSGNTLLNGGAGTDTLTGTSSNDLLIGGTGNDALTTGSGADIIAFNKGDGVDTVAVSTTKDNTLSIGGGTLYADLLFQKSGNDLLLKIGATDQITLTGYYTSTANRSVNRLQVVIEGTADYVPGSTDVTKKNKIETFNFDGLVSAFDAARAANPSLTTWALSGALAAQYLTGSDTAALGGDLAYRYGRLGTLSDISFTPAMSLLGNASFGAAAQTLQPLSGLQDLTPRLN